MTTTADLIARTRTHLMGGSSDRLNILDLNALAGDAFWQLRYDLIQIADGARLSIGLEDAYVIGVNTSSAGGQATLVRGYNGSAAVAHTAGDVVRVNPQFSDFEILSAINECIRELSGYGLFYVKPIEFAYSPVQGGYNINASDFMGIWRVRTDDPGPGNEWPILRKDYYYYDVHPNSTDFPGGVQFVMRVPGYPGFSVRVSYKARFAELAGLSDDVAVTSGVHQVAHGLIPIGAARILMLGQEVKRNFLTRQPEPRRMEEVPPGAILQIIEPLTKAYMDGIETYQRWLTRQYPEAI